MADPVPHDIRALADERSRARRAHDWATADRLKAALAAAGWNVVDAASLYTLERRPEAVVEVDGEVRFGTSEAVPSRLDEAPSSAATVVLVADDAAGVLARSVAAVLAHSPASQVVVVANQPSPPVAAEVVGLPGGVEVVRLASRLGAAAARNAGIRRAVGGVIVLMSPRLEAQGDLVGTLAAELADPTVSVAGIEGRTTTDLVHFTATPPGVTAADTVSLRAMAFRRADYIARGPLDEHFTLDAPLEAWWGFVLRDVPDDAGADATPGRAVVAVMPFGILGEEPSPPDERLAKKQRYRFLKWFASRRDLLVGAPGAEGAGDGTGSREIP
ncbi:MAG: glycosyltransferase family 2 protein [Candidatus Limnocylindrales bacterium]